MSSLTWADEEKTKFDPQKIKILIESFYKELGNNILNEKLIFFEEEVYAESLRVLKKNNKSTTDITNKDLSLSSNTIVWNHLKSKNEFLLFEEGGFDSDRVFWIFSDTIHVRGRVAQDRGAVCLMRYTAPGVAKVVCFPLVFSVNDSILIDVVNINVNGISLGPDSMNQVLLPEKVKKRDE
jgi:hypothetical protein